MAVMRAGQIYNDVESPAYIYHSREGVVCYIQENMTEDQYNTMVMHCLDDLVSSIKDGTEKKVTIDELQDILNGNFKYTLKYTKT